MLRDKRYVVWNEQMLRFEFSRRYLPPRLGHRERRRFYRTVHSFSEAKAKAASKAMGAVCSAESWLSTCPGLANLGTAELQTPSDQNDQRKRRKAMQLNDVQKHRVIYKFLPSLRGHWLEGESLDGFYEDATRRALKRGWSTRDLEYAAQSGKWSKQRDDSSLTH